MYDTKCQGVTLIYQVLKLKLNLPSVGTHLNILKCVNTTPPSIVTSVTENLKFYDTFSVGS